MASAKPPSGRPSAASASWYTTRHSLCSTCCWLVPRFTDVRQFAAAMLPWQPDPAPPSAVVAVANAARRPRDPPPHAPQLGRFFRHMRMRRIIVVKAPLSSLIVQARRSESADSLHIRELELGELRDFARSKAHSIKSSKSPSSKQRIAYKKMAAAKSLPSLRKPPVHTTPFCIRSPTAYG